MGKGLFKKIVVAINGSEASVRAAMYGIMLARTYNLDLKFVYVVDSATIKYLGMNQMLAKDEELDFKVDLAYEGQNTLDYILGLAASKGVTAESELKEGSVVTEILKCIKDFQADLLLIGCSESKPTERFAKRNIHSSHLSDIIANSKVSVVVVQQDDIENQFKNF